MTLDELRLAPPVGDAIATKNSIALIADDSATCRDGADGLNPATPALRASGTAMPTRVIKKLGHTFAVDISEEFDAVAHVLGVGGATAKFARFSELKHTWRRSGSSAAFKVSDYLDMAPREVIESLAWYLVSKAFDVKIPENKCERYFEYVRSGEMWELKRSIYFSRARGLSLDPRGSHRDLRVVFEYVNSTYFRRAIANPTLAWTEESPAIRLGYYFGPLNLLAVNRVFDSERVPRYVLEFVVYHELLHHIDAESGRRTRRVHHTKRFREQERRFSSWEDSERWLNKLVREHRRSRKKPGVPRA